MNAERTSLGAVVENVSPRNGSATDIKIVLKAMTKIPKNVHPNHQVSYCFQTFCLHHENMFVKCIPPNTPLLYSKSGVHRGIPIFLNIDCGYSLKPPRRVPTVSV